MGKFDKSLKEWQKRAGLGKKILVVGFRSAVALQIEEELLKLTEFKFLDGGFLVSDT